MKDHAQFAEDLALYAMGALDNQHCPELQAHLGACGECRRELQALRADMALLALSATGAQPPQRSRRRLMEAFAFEPRHTQNPARPIPPAPRRPRWLFWAPLAVSLALAAFTVHVLVVHQRAHREFEKLEAQLQAERQLNTHAKAVLDMINSPTIQRMTLVGVSKPPQPQVKTFYEKQSGHVLLLATSMEPLPADKVYELWLMPTKGEPMPAGTFRVERDGSAMMLHAMDTEGVEAKSFAITVEPLRGSKTPTLPIRYAPAG